MKAIGIEIDRFKVILYAVEANDDDVFTDITGSFKSLTIKDDYDNDEIREFASTIHSFFNNISPDRIGIIKRMTKGKYAASPVSFKIEGLIQCYVNCDVEFIPPATLTAFYKKSDFALEVKHQYQVSAAKLAQYLCS